VPPTARETLLALLDRPWRDAAPRLDAPADALEDALALGIDAGVGPLVAKRLLAQETLAPATRERAFAIRATSLVRHRASRARLGAALNALVSAGVDAFAIKGPLFAELAFEDAATRSSCDLDIVVPPAELDRSVSALAALGYAPADPGARADTALTGGLEVEDQGWPAIDLHVTLAKPLLVARPPWPAPRELLSRRTGERTLDEAWTLAHCAMELHKDRLSLRRIVDLAACHGRFPAETARRALAIARRAGLSGVLRAGAAVARALGAPSVPALGGAPPTWFQRALLARTEPASLVRPEHAGLGRFGGARDLVASWLLLDHPLAGVECLGLLLSPPREYLARRGGAVRRLGAIARRLVTP
jgi:hypothetical protein